MKHVGSRPQCFQFVCVEAVRVGCCQRRARLDQRLAPRHGEQQPQHRQWQSLLRRVGLLPLSPGEPVQILPRCPQPCPRAFCLGCNSAIPCLAFTPRQPPRNACGELRLRGEYARRTANDTRTNCTRPIREYPGNQPSQRVYPRPPDTSFDTLDRADGYSRPHRQLRSR